MAQTGLVSDYVDIPSFEAQTETARRLVRSLAQEIADVSAQGKKIEIQVNGAGSLKDVTVGTRDLVDAQGKLVSVSRDLASAYRDADAMVARYNGHSKEVVQVDAEMTKGKIQNAKLTRELLAADEQAASTRIALLKAQKLEQDKASAAIMNAARAVTEAAKADAIRTKSLIDQDREIDRIIALENKKSVEIAKANANESRQARELTNDYELLRKAYNDQANYAKNLGVTLGANSPLFKQAAADAQKMYGILAGVESAVGQNQRNVGNYKSAFDGLSSAQGNFSRSLAQISGEFTNLAYGARTFFSSLSNNIGPAFIEFKNLLAVMKAAKMEGVANAAAQGTQAAETAKAGGASEEAANQIGELAKQQALAALEGGKGVGVFAALRGALFSFSTIIGVAVAALTIFGPKIYDSIVEAFKDAKEAVDKNRISIETLNRALESVDFQKAVSEVNELRINIDLAKNGFLDKEKVVHQYNETIGETTGEVKSLNEAEAALIKNGDSYIKMMLLKAAANLALEDAAKKSIEAEQSRRKSLKDFATTGEKLDDEFLPDPNADEKLFGLHQITKAEQAQRNRRARAISDAQQAADAQVDIAKKFQQDAANIAKEMKFDFFGGTEDPDIEKEGKKPTDFTNERLKSEADFTTELYNQLKIRSEMEADSQKAIVENDNKTTNERITALDRYTQTRIESVGYGLSTEYDITEQKLAKIAEIETKSAKSRTKEEQDLLLQKDALQLRLENQEALFQKAVNKIVLDGEKLRQGIYDSEGQDRDKVVGDNLKKAKIAADQSIRDYNDRKKKEQELRDRRFENASAYTQTGIEFAQGLASVNSALTQRRLQEIDAEIAKINEKRDAEIAGINASTLSATDKEQKIADAKARAEGQTKALEADKIARARRAAQFEKGVTIASIIANTALAVIKAYTEGDPYTKVARAILAGTVGAAQLAIAIAAPLPQYEQGVEAGKHPGGPAIMAEGDKPELITEPGGRQWIAKKEGVYDLAKGAAVMSNKELVKMTRMYAIGLPQLIPHSGQATIDISGLRDDMRAVKSAIEAKPVSQLNVTGMGMQRLTRQAGQITEYIKSFSA